MYMIIQPAPATYAKMGQIISKVGPRTILKNKKICRDGFKKNKITRDQNPNSLYLQGPKTYFSHFKMS